MSSIAQVEGSGTVSGWGREMGKEVMEHYTETKSVAINLV